MSGCGDCDCDCGRGVTVGDTADSMTSGSVTFPTGDLLVPEVNPSLAYRLLNRDYLDDPR